MLSACAPPAVPGGLVPRAHRVAGGHESSSAAWFLPTRAVPAAHLLTCFWVIPPLMHSRAFHGRLHTVALPCAVLLHPLELAATWEGHCSALHLLHLHPCAPGPGQERFQALLRCEQPGAVAAHSVLRSSRSCPLWGSALTPPGFAPGPPADTAGGEDADDGDGAARGSHRRRPGAVQRAERIAVPPGGCCQVGAAKWVPTLQGQAAWPSRTPSLSPR